MIHFIYPVTEKTRPWSLVNHATVMLARKYHPRHKIVVWTNHVTDALLKTVRAAKASIETVELPTHVGGVEIQHPQYVSDVMRLQILFEQGGVYLDTDMLLRMDLYPYIDLAMQRDKLVLSWENFERSSICNALMITPPKNAFIGAWLDAMPEALRSTTWANGGVVLPVELAKRDDLRGSFVTLNHSFACPLDLSRPWLFDPALRNDATRLSSGSNAIHVFETYWRDTVKHVDADWIERTPCLFSDIFNELSGGEHDRQDR